MPKASILIVEDSFIVAFHLKATLESEGYAVIGQCDSGEKALDFVQKTPPDLVLMDIMLNGKLDGIETATLLKEKYFLPVIYITALTDKDTINRAKITEPYGYLTKPFEDMQIFTVIEMALYKHDIETRLRQSEEKYFSTINSISDCVITINREFTISYMNPSAEINTGWTLQEVIGKPVFECFQFSDDEMNVNPLQCLLELQGMAPFSEGMILMGKEGKEIPVGESSISAQTGKNGDTVGLILIFKNISDKLEKDKMALELKRAETQALIQGQEKERSRIAKDLHDGLGQMLNAIKMNVGIIMQDKNEASNFSRLLDEAIQESVRISENLLPAKLRDFDLPTNLHSLCIQTKETTRADIIFDNHLEKFEMGQLQKVNLYRIAQEAITNALKHSQPNTVTLQLAEENNILRMTIEDDGGGMLHKDNSFSSHRNGLINMRDRADSMGGKITFESDSKRGTLVIVEVPIIKLKKDE